MSKYDDWYNNLPLHTKEWLKKQPLWHDKDMAVAFSWGLFFGFLVGLIF